MDNSSSARARLTALGHQLIETHTHLLNTLDDIRDSATAPPDPAGPPGGFAVGSRDLAAHCLVFCSAVSRHHTAEDGTVFPLLAAKHPELRPVLDGLERDHVIMSGMLSRVSELAGRLDMDGALAELEGLAALIESHFRWEEKRLVDALNALPPDELDPQW
jgi:hypothetical protein